MDSEPKWRRFEKLVAEVQQELAPSAVVTHDDHIKGYDSKTPRQIDITVKQKIGPYEMLIAIDCKDYKVPVDVKDIEEFAGLVKDIRANKGVMVAANGFTDTAKRIGEKAGFNLYRLIDTEDHDWQTYVNIPMLCDFRRLTKFQFAFHTPIAGILSKMNPRDTVELVIYDTNHKPEGKIIELLKTNWDANNLPSEPGEHRDLILTKEPAMILNNNEFFEVRIFVNIIVQRRLFFGELPLIQVRGFADEYTGGVFTRGFTTDWLNFDEVEGNWRRLENEHEIAIRPVLSLSMLDSLVFP